MSTTAPETAAPAAPPTPEAVVEAEHAVENAAPESLKVTAEQVSADFNAALADTTVAAEENVPAVDAAGMKEAPGVTTSIDELAQGHFAQVLNQAPAVVKEVKSGYKTTEFWLTIIGVILTQIGALHLPGKYGDTITTAALIASYALSRGLAK